MGLTALMLNCNSTPKYDTTAAKMELAKCLVREEATMYGAEWCGYCRLEKKELGPAWGLLQKNYVDCTEDLQPCAEVATPAGIISFPTWKFKNGNIVRSYTPNFLEVLAEESGCD